MNPIDQRLITLRRGVIACRETPGRVGRLIHLADADDVLIGGDLHGQLDNLRRLVRLADLVTHPRRHLVIQEIVHGPFRHPNGGGDRSYQVVEAACALMVQFPGRVHYLMGNHELAQLTGRRVGKMDEDDLNELFKTGVRTTYGTRADEVYGVYCKLFESAPLAIRTAGRLLIAHSVPAREFDANALTLEPTPLEQLAPGGSVYALVWGRDTRPETLETFLRTMDAEYLVSGHIPNDAGYERPSVRHLILDCKGHPAGAALLPANRPITPEEFANCHQLLS
ncbi:MAG: hypothetical protein EBV06_00225 [Planctomycetia bacterium]|nr:hypothetical protein [Planctomycetia bacterium]